jgi:hypothetical protein
MNATALYCYQWLKYFFIKNIFIVVSNQSNIKSLLLYFLCLPTLLFIDMRFAP